MEQAKKMNCPTCLHKLLGHCPRCTPDFNPTHHPNNLECPGFKPVGFLKSDVSKPSGRKREKTVDLTPARMYNGRMRTKKAEEKTSPPTSPDQERRESRSERSDVA